MKKPLVLLFLLCFLISACGSNKPETDAQSEHTGNNGVNTAQTAELGTSIADYHPFKPDTLYVYEGEGHSFAAYSTYNTFIQGGRAQKIFRPSIPSYNSSLTEVLEIANGELRFINGDPYYYHFKDLTSLEPDENKLLVILKEPLVLGAKWDKTVDTVSEVTAVDFNVTVPYGTFSALEVTTTSPNGQITKDYYVKGIGLVLTEHNLADRYIKTELAEIHENTAISVVYNYFFPDGESGEIHTAQNEIELTTNYNEQEAINAALTAPHPLGAYEPLVLTDVYTSAEMDYKTYIATINFNSGVYGHKFANAEEERVYAHCLALVAGGLLAADYAFVYVDNKPYEGEFFTQDTQQPFTTNVDKLIKELQEQAEE